MYSHTLDGLSTAFVFIDDDWQSGDPVTYELPVQPGGYLEVTPDPADVPVGLYYVAVAPTAGGQKSLWMQALNVVEAGSDAAPLVVANEEDESCEGPGTECAHPIVPGQTWQGEWGEAGDADYFSFVAGAGVQVQVTLDFIEGTEGIGDDSRAPDPEVTIVEPSGIYTFDGYADDRSPTDTNAMLDWTTRGSGVHFIIASTKQGTGQYRVHLEVVGEAAGQEFLFEPYNTAAHLVWANEVDVETGDPLPPTTTLQGNVIDPFGRPVAGAKVTWSTLSGTPALSGSYLTSLNGDAVIDVDMSSTDEAEIEPVFSLPTLPSAPQAQHTERTPPHTVDPVIGILVESNGAILSDRPLPSTSLAEIRRAVQGRRSRETIDDVSTTTAARAQASPNCGKTYTIYKLTLPSNARALKSMKLELRDAADQPFDELTGIRVTEASDPFSVHMIGTFLDKQTPPQTFTQEIAALPVDVAAKAAGTPPQTPAVSFDVGATWCQTIHTTTPPPPVDLLYRTGSDAFYLRYMDGDPDPFKYATTEVLRASISAPVQIPSGTGSYLLRRIALTKNLPVTPKPGPPQSVSFLPPDSQLKRLYYVDNPVHPSMTDNGTTYYYVLGPAFKLLDQYGNKNVEAGYRGPGTILTDKTIVGLTNGGENTDPLWFAVAFPGSGTYYTMRAITGSGTPIPAATYTKNLHVESGGAIADQPVSMEVVTGVPVTAWRCPASNTKMDCGGYGPLLSSVAQPGFPVLTPFLEPVELRIHPVLNTELSDPAPANPYSGVPYKVYLSGPTSSPTTILLNDQDKPAQADDVEFTPASVTADGSGGVVVTLEPTPSEKEVQVTSTTGVFGGSSGQDEGTAIWVSRAPRQPGYYQVIAEPLDPAFIGQYTDWDRAYYTILVTGARLLHEDYSPIGYESIDQEATYWLEYVASADEGPPDGLVFRYEDAEGNTDEQPVIFRPCTASLFSCSYLAELHLKPTEKPIIGEPAPCPDCTVIRVHPTAFKVEVGQSSGTPGEPLPRPLATMYGHGAVEEIPLGEYRRLTYAIHNVPVHAPGAGDHPVVSTWKDEWGNAPPAEMASGTAWFSTLVDPTTNGSQLTYEIDAATNQVNLVYNYTDPSDSDVITIPSLSFRNITRSASDVGYVMAFHVASDVLHPLFDQNNPPIPNSFLPPDTSLQTSGYGPERVKLTLTDSNHPGEPATVQLRGVVPEHIQSDFCRNQNPGDPDHECATKVIGDAPTPQQAFSLDNLIVYFCDRQGLPPDVIKAQVFHESANGGVKFPGTDKYLYANVKTNAYKYEPYTFDFKTFAGGGWDPQKGRKCEDLSVYSNTARRIEVEPYCQYAFAGRVVEDKSLPSRAITIPAATTTMDLFDAGIPNHLDLLEQLKLFIVEPGASPDCITPSAGPPPCSPPQGDFGAQMAGWIQVAEHDHGKPGSTSMHVYPGRAPAGQEFSIAYGKDSALLTLGSAPSVDLTLTIFPQLNREIPYGTGTDKRGEKVLNLPSVASDLQSFLDSLHDGPECKVYPVHPSATGDPETDTISKWIRDSRISCGGWNFLRDGTSHEELMIDLSGNTLYDPQLTVNAQYLLSGTFGLMQYGIINHQYNQPWGKMMRLEYDFGAPFTAQHEYHVFQQILNPAVSVQVGTALDSYLLHIKEGLKNSCGANCQQSVLQLKVKSMLSRYNSNARFDPNHPDRPARSMRSPSSISFTYFRRIRPSGA